jgi:hypothetical protein
MLCALTVRQLKPGTFDRIAEREVRLLRRDPRRARAEPRRSGDEERRAAVDDMVDEVVVNGVFAVVREMSVA